MKKIQLSKTSKRPDKHYALVDDDDYDRLNQWNWSYAFNKKDGREWAFRKEWPSGKTISMSRFVVDAPSGLEVDHINRDPLDNRRKNLRLATRSQNAMNKSIQSNNTTGYRGVYPTNRPKPWYAKVKFNNQYVYLGAYKTKKEAAHAYNEKAQELFGDFAVLNALA